MALGSLNATLSLIGIGFIFGGYKSLVETDYPFIWAYVGVAAACSVLAIRSWRRSNETAGRLMLAQVVLAIAFVYVCFMWPGGDQAGIGWF